MNYENNIFINGTKISLSSPTYFVADVASNHDGELNRAKDLIWKAKEAGANAVKFQHFKAKDIVSDFGFKNLKKKSSHQATWKKSVFEVYKQYECNREWTQELIETSKKAEITFLTTPYDYQAIEALDPFLSAYKIGSGDITWTHFIAEIAKKNKPIMLSTGASTIQDVQRAIKTIQQYNKQIILMQCNTNYTGKRENFQYINLNVLKTFATMYPQMILGLSDHTPLHASVLGAITLGARVIEKHFTDDSSKIGPDHSFSLTPQTWREMVDRSRELELALGDGIKRVEANEKETIVLQQRCIRLKRAMKQGETITQADIEYLRPAPLDALKPFDSDIAIGNTLITDKQCGDALYLSNLKKTNHDTR